MHLHKKSHKIEEIVDNLTQNVASCEQSKGKEKKRKERRVKNTLSLRSTVASAGVRNELMNAETRQHVTQAMTALICHYFDHMKQECAAKLLF